MPPAISAGIVLATPWMAYGGMLFGHSLAAALAGGGMLLALGPIPVDPERSGAPGEAPGRDRFRTAVAGLLLGLAVLTEYPAVVLAILVAASLAVDPARRRLLPWLALGALPAVAGLLAWNQANFGSLLLLSYGYKNDPEWASICTQGAFGMTYPSLERLNGILLGPSRGLLFVSPWLLAGFAGAFAALRNRQLAPAWRVTLGAGIPAWCLWIGSFVDWTAGDSFGPRHLLAGLPLFAVGVAVFLAGPAGRYRFVRPILWGLMASSFLLVVATAWTFPYLDPAVANPVAEIAVPALLQAGPAPSSLDPWIPWPIGPLVSIACALGLAGLGAWAERARFREVLAWTVAAASAVIHLAIVTIPETPPEAGARLRDSRAMAFEMMGRADLADQVRRGSLYP
jgi:hypothetical protein